MRRTRSRSPRISAAEPGYTVIELTVTLGLLMTIIVAVTTVFLSVQRSAAFVQDRSETLDRMRLAVDQMTKDIRQATSIAATSSVSLIDMETYVNGTSTHIVYEADGDVLTRTIDGVTTVVLEEDLATTSLFTYTPDVTDVRVVSVTLSVHPVRRPDTTLILTSEARLRNRSAA